MSSVNNFSEMEDPFDCGDIFLSDEDNEEPDPKIITPQNRARFNYNTETFEESQDSFDIPSTDYLGYEESDNEHNILLSESDIDRDLMSSFA